VKIQEKSKPLFLGEDQKVFYTL